MPNFRGPRQSTSHVTNIYADDQNLSVLGKNLEVFHTSTDERIIHNPITIILFQPFSSGTAIDSNSLLFHNDIIVAAANLTLYHWAVYGFSNGHFAYTIHNNNHPSRVIVAADTSQTG